MDAVSILLNPSGTAGQSRQNLRSRAIEILDGTVFGGMLAVIVLTAIPYGTVQPWWISVFECGVFALGAAWILQGSLAHRWRLTNGFLLGPLAGLLLFAFVQSLPILIGSGNDESRTISADPFQTRLWVLHFGALLLGAVILFSHTSNLRRLRSLINVVIAIGVVSAMFGLLRHAMHFGLPIQEFLPAADQGTYGQFINRNHFALLMEMSLGLVSGLIVAGGMRHAYLPLYLAATVVLWLALVLSNSRGGILAMLGQSLFLALFWNTARKQAEAKTSAGRSVWLQKPIVKGVLRAVLAMCLVTIVIVGVVWVGGDALMHRLEVLPRELRAESSTRENSSRLAIWKATIAMIQDHPVAGVGFGAYRVPLPRYHDASGKWIPQEAHNDYLELIASGGIIAAALALLFFTAFFRNVWQCLNAPADPFRRAGCFGALVGLFGVVIHSFVDFGLHTTVNAAVCFALIVIATKTFAVEERTQQTGTW